MNNTLLSLLKEHKQEIIQEGKALVVGLKNGYCVIEKGVDNTPFSIKVEEFGKNIPLDIEEFLGEKNKI